MFSKEVQQLIDSQNLPDSDKILPSYAWPGGYPLYYIDNVKCDLCPACAQKLRDDEDLTIVSYAINWEDTKLFCEECSERIESAYGEDTDMEDVAEWNDMHMAEDD